RRNEAALKDYFSEQRGGIMIRTIGTRIFRSSRVCLVLSILSLAPEAYPQVNVKTNDFLPPPKANLLALHWPDLTGLEPEVREQLKSLQTALENSAKDPNITEVGLSEAYGNIGKHYQAYSLNAAARESYLNARRLRSQDFRWVYLLGRLDQQDDRLDDAIRGY